MSDIKICDICGKRIPTFEGRDNYTVNVETKDDAMVYTQPTESFDMCEEDFKRIFEPIYRAKIMHNMK